MSGVMSEADLEGLTTGPPPESKTFLALFDVLGFAKHVERHTIRSVVHNITQILLPVVDVSTTGALLVAGDRIQADPSGRMAEFLVFSDSILLYSRRFNREGFVKLTAAARRLVGTSIQAGIPLRGAITQGELFVSRDKSVYVGRGLVRAYRMEKSQDWAGGFIDPEIEKIADLENYITSLEKDGTLFRHRIPAKGWRRPRRLCLGWPQKLSIDEGGLWGSLHRLDPEPDRRARRKIAHTSGFFRDYRAMHPAWAAAKSS